jgi:phosphatidate cytidylyltransferase
MSGPVLDGSSGAGRWGDLNKRLISAAVLMAVGAVDIWLGGSWFLAMVVVLIGVMIWELANITAPRDPTNSIGLAIIAGLNLFAAANVSYPLVLIFLITTSVGFLLTRRSDRLLAAVVASAFVVAGLGLILLRNGFGTPAVLWLVGVVIVSDVSGYFAGRMIGGPKFWPNVSPKKTWSGTIAGWVGAAIFGGVFVVMGMAPALLIPLSVVTALAGQMGDIGESWIKRRAGVKDSSNLIPGHGGVMDRFDALTGAAVAVVVLGLLVPLPLPVGP